MKSFKKIIAPLAYLFVFLLPWQTKLILRPDFSNYNEISLYLWEIVAFVLVVSFLIYKWPEIIKVGAQFATPGKIPVYLRLQKVPAYLWLLAILELFTLISIFVAPDKLLALNYYFLFLLGIGVFFIFKANDLNISKAKITLAFLYSLIFQVILAIAQFLTQTTWANKYFGLAYHNPALAGTAVIETMSGRWLRAYGGFDHPNVLAGFLVIGLLLAANFIITLPRKYKADSQEGGADKASVNIEKQDKYKYLHAKIKLWPAIFIWVFYLLGLVALYFSFSRTAWLAYGLALIIWAVFYLTTRARENLGKLIALIIISVVLIFVLNSFFSDLTTTRLTKQGRLEDKSINERQEYLVQAGELIRTNYLFGVGRGNYVNSLVENDIVRTQDYPQPVHNVFALALTEIGLFGFLAFVIFLFYAIKKTSARALGAGVFIALIVLMALDHWLWSLPGGLVFFWLVLGLIW